MTTAITISQPLLAALVEIARRGHVATLECGPAGNSHTSTYVTIGFRRPGDAGIEFANSIGFRRPGDAGIEFANNLRIKFTASYGRFSTWTAVSREFDELCFGECSLRELLDRGEALAAARVAAK